MSVAAAASPDPAPHLMHSPSMPSSSAQPSPYGTPRTDRADRIARVARTARTARPAVALACLIAASPATAQPAAPEDWPCVQVLVPEVSVATLWPVPLDPAEIEGWREDRELRAVAERFAALEDGDDAARDEAETALAGFVAATPESEREARLGRLAGATVELVDERRGDYIDGIRRFTRGQIALAGEIEAALNALADAGGTGTGATVGADAIALSRADSGAGRGDAEDTLRWQERLYDQRERQVRALCERPVRLEETLSRSLREFAASLPASG